AMWRPTEPSVSVASKGMVSFSIEVTGAGRDLHSGRYGGTVANAAQVLATVIASLHDDDGRVAVSGFYDGVHDLSPERRAEIDQVDFTEDGWLADVGAPQLHGEPGYSTLQRLWERPTLEVNGLEAGGKYTVIPHLAKAHLSCRLVHEQDPVAVLAAITHHVESRQWQGVRVRVVSDDVGVPAYRVADDDPSIVSAVLALNEVYPGQQVLHTVIAGTLPCTTLFEEVLGAKTLFFSFSTADERLHAPNEFLRLPRITDGMRAWEVLWRNLAGASPGDFPR
ncbi:MAG: peptidase dimerization domain-containing protein, partial [Actinoallomurus sp.]